LRASDAGSEITLVAVTGWGQAADRARTAAAGFDDHLTKPIDPGVLSALLAQRGRRIAG
jgi:CheY-like chemotaxis protein